MSEDGNVYNCKNHQSLRWFDTKPNGALTFMGEITDDGKLREPTIDPGSPMKRLRYYFAGKNPYAPSLDLPEPFTFERLKQYLAYVEKVEAIGYSFECECPPSDLVRLPDETYESVSNRPHVVDMKG